MDAFFASVEQRDHPEWRGKPVIVGSPPTERGVVSTCSYEARAFGVHSAMPSREAGRLCPHGIFVPGNHAKYAAVSQQVFDIFERFTPWVEPVSIDEAFLDVSGATTLFGPPEAIATAIRAAIHTELGLTASVGVAPNMFLAKLASDEHKPDGLTIVPSDPEGIQRFLDPLPVHRIWGVGKQTAARLLAFGCHTIRDLREMSNDVLASCLGSPEGALHFKRLAHGIDDRSISLDFQEKSLSREHTYLSDESSLPTLEATLQTIAQDVGQRLRSKSLYATVGRLKLRWADFHTITRQRPFPLPSCDDLTLRDLALSLLHDAFNHKPIRLIGFGVSGLQNSPTPNTPPPPTQLFLFEPPQNTAATPNPAQNLKRENLCKALDSIRSKRGSNSIRFLGSEEPPPP